MIAKAEILEYTRLSKIQPARSLCVPFRVDLTHHVLLHALAWHHETIPRTFLHTKACYAAEYKEENRSLKAAIAQGKRIS